MLQDFNVFGEYVIPDVTLCYPNRKKIGDLGRLLNLTLDLKFNTYSEVTIEIPYEVDGIKTPFYDKLVQKNKLHVVGYGYFIIQNVVEVNDGIKRYKTVPAYSEEYSLTYRSVSLLDGTYKFYDTSPSAETIMSKIMDYIPNWTLGSVSTSLWTKYRTFDVTNETLYSFMMNSVSNAYECFFIFDTETRTVYVKDTADVVNTTAIYLSYDNLIKNAQITEKSDEFVTALSVLGGGDLDIRTVNPLGTNFIYDFSYPMEQGQMSEDLYDAIDLWNQKIDAYQISYAAALSTHKTLNTDLLTHQAELTSLRAEKTAVEAVMQTRIDAGQTDLSDLAAQIAVIDSSIQIVNGEITTAQSDIQEQVDILSNINTELSFATNFTGDLYNELLDYIIESSYQNENIIKTSIMTSVDVQNQAQELYNQGKNILDKLSQPRFEFSVDSANFVFLKDYLQVTNQLSLGSVVNVELQTDLWATPILLQLHLNFYNPTDFSMTFANRYRLDDPAHEFAELIRDTINKGSNIGVDSQLWTDWSKNYQTDVSQFLTSPLNAAKNQLINADNEQIIIDQVGLRGKREVSAGNYSPEQVWLTSNTLAFTSDNWNTVTTALGKVTLPDNTTTYGLVADAIVTGVLNAGLVRIFGTNDFYWDNDNIVLHYPDDGNKEIRIGKYDGTNYGIAFTTDGGDTWQSAIGFDGVVLSTSDQTRLTNLETTVGDADSGLVKDVTDAQSSISLNSEQIALRVENTTYYKNVPIYLSTDPSLTWTSQQKIDNVGYLWYQISTNITWRWNGLAWINTSPINSYDDPSAAWDSAAKLANIGYLWGDRNGETIIDFDITLPSIAEIQSGINYILVCFDNTKIINTVFETVVGYYRIGDVVYCDSVSNTSGYVTIDGDYVLNNWYNITVGGVACKVNQAKARAMTISEQTAYLGGYFQG